MHPELHSMVLNLQAGHALLRTTPKHRERCMYTVLWFTLTPRSDKPGGCGMGASPVSKAQALLTSRSRNLPPEFPPPPPNSMKRHAQFWVYTHSCDQSWARDASLASRCMRPAHPPLHSSRQLLLCAGEQGMLHRLVLDNSVVLSKSANPTDAILLWTQPGPSSSRQQYIWHHAVWMKLCEARSAQPHHTQQYAHPQATILSCKHLSSKRMPKDSQHSTGGSNLISGQTL